MTETPDPRGGGFVPAPGMSTGGADRVTVTLCANCKHPVAPDGCSSTGWAHWPGDSSIGWQGIRCPSRLMGATPGEVLTVDLDAARARAEAAEAKSARVEALLKNHTFCPANGCGWDVRGTAAGASPAICVGTENPEGCLIATFGDDDRDPPDVIAASDLRAALADPETEA